MFVAFSFLAMFLFAEFVESKPGGTYKLDFKSHTVMMNLACPFLFTRLLKLCVFIEEDYHHKCLCSLEYRLSR